MFADVEDEKFIRKYQRLAKVQGLYLSWQLIQKRKYNLNIELIMIPFSLFQFISRCSCIKHFFFLKLNIFSVIGIFKKSEIK